MGLLVYIFGEDQTDTAAIEQIVIAINEARKVPLRDVQTKPLRDPPILRRDALPAKRVKISSKIAGFVRGASIKHKHILAVVHRDCDALEPAHSNSAKELLEDLIRAGVHHAVVATPAWEIEAWWMLFPQALKSTRPCWQDVDYGNSNVGSFANAKEKLRRDLRPRDGGKRCPDYTERDGIKIATEIRTGKLYSAGRRARSASFECFAQSLEEALTSQVKAGA